MKLLKLNNVGLTYQTTESETTALKNISFDVADGEFVAIIGPSGCGKTTILSLIAGLILPTEGEITLCGEKVCKPRHDVGYMLQRDQLFEWRNILQNVTLGPELQRKNTSEAKEYAVNLLEKYGLGEFKKHFPKQLSGGMRQRVALIRTLALKPRILLLDEPFSALDFQTRLNVHDDISSIIAKEKKTALLVTHDISEAISLSDRIIVLSKHPGTVKKIFNVELSSKKPHEKRDSPLYPALFEKIWKEVSSRNTSEKDHEKTINR